MTIAALHHTRRYDLDWLRVIAFVILIFYHIGMFYVTWEWHVKSTYENAGPEPLMILINPWRLSLLFFISGVAIRFASDKTPALKFIWSRTWRLFLPIAFGMHVIVAPQTYYQLRQLGIIDNDFWHFYLLYLSFEQPWDVYTPTWNHLWYIVYLMVYTWVLMLIRPLIGICSTVLNAVISFSVESPLRLLIIPTLPFVIYRFLLTPYFPTTHNLTSDWANHAISFTIFIMGYLIAKHELFWRAIERNLHVLSIAVILSAICLKFIWHPPHWTVLENYPAPLTAARIWRIFYTWWVILLMLSFGVKFLQRPSAVLRYMTKAVFPWYILHQTIIVVAGYHITRYKISAWPEFVTITVITVMGCIIGTEIIRRIPIVRLLFGWR